MYIWRNLCRYVYMYVWLYRNKGELFIYFDKYLKICLINMYDRVLCVYFGIGVIVMNKT